jgi:hypothetical protein
LPNKPEPPRHDSESDTETLERHYRVVLDFRVLARPITAEVCRESFFFNDGEEWAGTPEFLESVERQRRLYKLLRDDKELLQQYLLAVLTQEAGNFVYEGLPDAFDTKDEEELLTPLYEGMNKEDVQFFEECRREGSLDANTELIATAFKVEWVGAEVEEMNRKLTGDVKRAEVAERATTRAIRKFISTR